MPLEHYRFGKNFGIRYRDRVFEPTTVLSALSANNLWVVPTAVSSQRGAPRDPRTNSWPDTSALVTFNRLAPFLAGEPATLMDSPGVKTSPVTPIRLRTLRDAPSTFHTVSVPLASTNIDGLEGSLGNKSVVIPKIGVQAVYHVAYSSKSKNT